MVLFPWLPRLPSALGFPLAPADLAFGVQGLRQWKWTSHLLDPNSRHTTVLPCLIWGSSVKRRGSVLKE